MSQHPKTSPNHFHINLAALTDKLRVLKPINMRYDPINCQIPIKQLHLRLGSQEDGHSVIWYRRGWLSGRPIQFEVEHIGRIKEKVALRAS